jgi:hypothetical protein
MNLPVPVIDQSKKLITKLIMIGIKRKATSKNKAGRI